MAEAKKSIGERLWDAEARLGVIILIEAAHDGESACDALDAFIEDDIHEDYVIADLSRDWPDFGRLYAVNTDDEDADRYFRRCAVLDLLQSQCPKRYLVRVEHTVKELVLREEGAGFPYGTWRSGWGYSQLRWCLVDSVEDAVDRAIEYAIEQKREAWDAYEKPVKRRKEKRRG